MSNQTVLLQYWIELRKRVIFCLLLIGLIFCILLYFSNDLFTLLAIPLLQFLPQGKGLIATNVLSTVLVPLEFTFTLSLFTAVPICLYQAWSFIAPALYNHEKKHVWLLLCTSTILFYLGIAFTYCIILPLLFKFLTYTAPQGIQISPDIAQYLSFTLKLFFTFGLIFEIPIIMIILAWTHLVPYEKFLLFRPYAIISAFIIGMLLSPPDVISQIMLALPIWLLYELGIVISKLLVRRHDKKR